MCGIVGLISGPRRRPDLIEALVDPIAHRGPDDRGTWIDRGASVALGHRRLAIIDLSVEGHQPMVSANGRWVLSYNGEIYNHRDLRRDLDAGHHVPEGGWRGSSDTETLVEAIAIWGLEKALERATGMFAFALFDRKDRKLFLARDRFGEKPLYYGWTGGDFVFGSELKALTAHPTFDNPISTIALEAFMSRSYVPAPLSIYERIFKLQPGCILEVTTSAPKFPLRAPPAEDVANDHVRLKRYWSYGDVLEQGLSNPITDESSAIDALEEALARSIRNQSIADVPVGAFLSGGIDSSSIVALYQKYSNVPVRSFTIGFDDAHFNEAEHARSVASHLGTIHDEHYVTPTEASSVIPLLPRMFDEPFGDSSAIPTYLVSRFARSQVKVALSGDGGDELFAGYLRHAHALSVWKNLRKIPVPARRAGAAAIGRLPPALWTRLDKLLGASRRSPLRGKVHKGLEIVSSVRTFDDLYSGYLDQWPLEGPPVVGGSGGQASFPLDPGFDAPDAVRMIYCDAVAYLPDDILCKVDRASMAVSLETRVPFLDHEVASVAARIPMSMKLKSDGGKWVLRELLGRHLPKSMFERPKSGFAMPITDWLSGDLRPWAEDLLDPARMRQDGYFDVERVQSRWHDNLERRRNAATSIWSILMFQAWLRSVEEEHKSVGVETYAA